MLDSLGAETDQPLVVSLQTHADKHVGGRVGPVRLDCPRSFFQGAYNAVRIVFQEVNPVGVVVGVGGEILVVFMGGVVDELGIEVAQGLQLALPFRKVFPSPSGPRPARGLRHVGIGNVKRGDRVPVVGSCRGGQPFRHRNPSHLHPPLGSPFGPFYPGPTGLTPDTMPDGTVSISLILVPGRSRQVPCTGRFGWPASGHVMGRRAHEVEGPASVFSSRVRRARGLKRPNQPSSQLVPAGMVGCCWLRTPGRASVPRGATAGPAPPAPGAHAPAPPPARAPAG